MHSIAIQVWARVQKPMRRMMILLRSSKDFIRRNMKVVFRLKKMKKVKA